MISAVSALLRIDRERFDVELSLAEYGMDSIALKDLAAVLSETYGAEISPALFFARPSIAEIAEYLEEEHEVPVRGEPARPADAGAVAISGMSGIFPGSPDLEAFWSHLERGEDLIGEVPADRWNWGDYPPENRWGGFLDPEVVDRFDAAFFGQHHLLSCQVQLPSEVALGDFPARQRVPVA